MHIFLEIQSFIQHKSLPNQTSIWHLPESDPYWGPETGNPLGSTILPPQLPLLPIRLLLLIVSLAHGGIIMKKKNNCQ